MNSKLISRAVLVSMVLAASAHAQQQFQLLVTVGDNVSLVQSGSTLTFSSAIGQLQTGQVRVTYTGARQVTLSPPTLIGSGAFTVKAAAPQLTLNPGDSFSFDIQFLPASSAQSSAQVILNFSEKGADANAASTAGTIQLFLQGTAFSFVLSYVPQTDQNVVPLQPGGTIVFPATPVKTTGQAALNVTNRGSGPGTVTGISIKGSAFRLSGLPLFPVTLLSGQNLQVQVLYQPVGLTSDTGQITITFDSGSPATLNLQGSGTSASFVYQIFQTNPLTVLPGGTVSLPDTNVGETSSVVIRVLNSGNASGAVNSITLAGQGFQLANVPVLPQTLPPDASLTFTVTFAPTRPGTLSGSLIINSDTFDLLGVGLGPQLILSYIAGGTSITLSPSASSVVFSPVMISRSAQIVFRAKNSGTLPASIANIGVGQVNSPFSVTGLPALPITLAPNVDVQFTINFAPTALGFSNGTLLIDTTSVPLVGSGTQPPPLPSYTITGPTGNTAPGSQLGIGLTLASAYPVAIAGTLTLGVSGELPSDPAVQFATGGRSVAFVIPANSTNAVFGSQQGTRVGLQTGTVAGTITLTPSFATQAGNVDLNPNTPAVVQTVIAPAPPILTAVQLSSPAANTLLIRVTGLSTTRTLKAWNVQFTTAPGVQLPTSQFTIDVQQIAATWFRSTASQAFGGQFTMAIQFNFQGAASDSQPALNGIASVAVTVSSELGDSNSMQAKVQ